MFAIKSATAQSVYTALVSSENAQIPEKGPEPSFKRFWHRLWGWFLRKSGQQTAASSTSKSIADSSVDVGAEAAEKSVMLALQSVGTYLADVGLTLGQDFSYGQGSLILSDQALVHLQQKLGPELFERIMAMEGPGLFQQNNLTAVQALEEHLGVPFFENLQQAIEQRVPTLTDAEVICYFTRLIQGFSYRHPEIKQFDLWTKALMHRLIKGDRLEDISRRHSEGLLTVGPDDGWVLFLDLITSAGGIEGVHLESINGSLEATPAGFQLLDQLIAGPDSRCADLTAGQ